MGPDISRFCMNSEYGCEALSKARQGGTVTLLEEIIVLKHFSFENNSHWHEKQITYWRLYHGAVINNLCYRLLIINSLNLYLKELREVRKDNNLPWLELFPLVHCKLLKRLRSRFHKRSICSSHLTSAFSAALYTRGLKSSHRGSDQGMSDQAISCNTRQKSEKVCRCAIKTKYFGLCLS